MNADAEAIDADFKAADAQIGLQFAADIARAILPFREDRKFHSHSLRRVRAAGVINSSLFV